MIRSLADPDLDDSDRKLLKDVQRVGWGVLLIPEEAGTPGWAFSVGLFHTFAHPEVVVFGLPQEVAYLVVNGIGKDVQAGRAYEAEQEYPDILEGVRCMFRPVARRWYRPFLGTAMWFYRGEDFPVLQCVWPDKRQHYPWEAKFRKSWLWAQPLLYESDPEAARAVHLLESIDEE